MIPYPRTMACLALAVLIIIGLVVIGVPWWLAVFATPSIIVAAYAAVYTITHRSER